MKTKVLKKAFFAILLIALGFSANAQSGTFYLRDANSSGYTYRFSINVYDNSIPGLLYSTWDGFYNASPNATNSFSTLLQVPVDTDVPRWRIVIKVDKLSNGLVVSSQFGYSALLTTNQFYGSGIAVSQINF